MIELSDEFVERRGQRLAERCAAILSDGFLRDQDRKDVRLGELGGGKALDGFGVIEAVAARVEGNRHAALCAHEFDIASDGAFGDLQARGHDFGVWIGAGADPCVDLRDAFPGAAAVEDGTASAEFSNFDFEFLICRTRERGIVDG